MAQSNVLAANALNGLRVAISVSESDDLLRLGLVEIHFRLALAEIARSVITSGGKLAYGGHIEPTGYTAFLIQELHRYSRRDRPLRVYLAWPEHRRVSLGALRQQTEELGPYGEIVCLDSAGKPVATPHQRDDNPTPITDPAEIATSLTSMRQSMTTDTNGRILLGGRREGFQGTSPGVAEEAFLTLENRQPLYLVGGFGGVTLDIISSLGIDDCDWLPPSNTATDDRLKTSLVKIRDFAAGRTWQILDNGLSAEENLLLARTPRPSEIAALISLGLGRRLAKSIS